MCVCCLAHSVLSLGNTQSFHKVNFIVLFLTKTCIYQKPGYFFFECLGYAVDFSWFVKNSFSSVQIVLKYSVAEDS